MKETSSTFVNLAGMVGFILEKRQANFPCPSHVPGRCLGSTRNKGNSMAQCVLNRNGTQHELVKESEIKSAAILMNILRVCLVVL